MISKIKGIYITLFFILTILVVSILLLIIREDRNLPPKGIYFKDTCQYRGTYFDEEPVTVYLFNIKNHDEEYLDFTTYDVYLVGDQEVKVDHPSLSYQDPNKKVKIGKIAFSLKPKEGLSVYNKIKFVHKNDSSIFYSFDIGMIVIDKVSISEQNKAMNAHIQTGVLMFDDLYNYQLNVYNHSPNNIVIKNIRLDEAFLEKDKIEGIHTVVSKDDVVLITQEFKHFDQKKTMMLLPLLEYSQEGSEEIFYLRPIMSRTYNLSFSREDIIDYVKEMLVED